MNILGYLQKIGRALMVPVATLPAAAILMGVGYWIDPTGWGGNSALAAFFIKSGAAIIDNMPILFAIGVAYGMSQDKDGAAALAGFVGYMVVTTLCAPDTVAQIGLISLNAESTMAFSKIGNQFVGILIGITAAEIYNKFHTTQLHKALAFFSGKRLVPILTSFAAIGISFILMYVWPPIFSGLIHFGETITGMGAAGAGIYGFFNRLLIPVGLHHALNTVFWFDFAGINDLGRFWMAQQGLDSGEAIKGVTGMYMGGFFPIMMFGLPGAALAFYHTAKPENKTKVASIMIAAGFACFFTGVTEPLEFAFMFVAPMLYVIHAILAGLSVAFAAMMQWTAGFGFSAGLVDLVLSASNPVANKWYMLLIQGAVFFCLYYFIFRLVITKMNLKTPGREDNDDEECTVVNSSTNNTELAEKYLAALGGHENLTTIDACITRLRLTCKDRTKVNEKAITALGAAGIIHLGENNLQVVLGPLAEIIAGEMQKIH